MRSARDVRATSRPPQQHIGRLMANKTVTTALAAAAAGLQIDWRTTLMRYFAALREKDDARAIQREDF